MKTSAGLPRWFFADTKPAGRSPNMTDHSKARQPVLTFALALSATAALASGIWVAEQPASVPASVLLPPSTFQRPLERDFPFNSEASRSDSSDASSTNTAVELSDRSRPETAVMESRSGQTNHLVYPAQSPFPDDSSTPSERNTITEFSSPTIGKSQTQSSERNAQTQSQPLLSRATTASLRAPAVPLAFQEPPPDVNADPQKTASLRDLRQSFVDAIGGPDQDPADPAYYKRWVTAQAASDEQFSLLFGGEAFLPSK